MMDNDDCDTDNIVPTTQIAVTKVNSSPVLDESLELLEGNTSLPFFGTPPVTFRIKNKRYVRNSGGETIRVSKRKMERKGQGKPNDFPKECGNINTVAKKSKEMNTILLPSHQDINTEKTKSRRRGKRGGKRAQKSKRAHE